ncbi:MAG TPA: zinc ribbon domain-containing protein [Mycobacterium sp.]|nr:zinc ribbon domain-containing protein [Mycobacterium sp.]
MTATTACRTCGTELLDDVRFCHGCGSAVAATAIPAGHQQMFADVYSAREKARQGDREGAIPLIRAGVDRLFGEEPLRGPGIPATGVLVETLLEVGTESDIAEAEATIERLAAAPTEESALREVWLLRLRALLALARGEGVKYLGFLNRYRNMATSLGFEGHIAWAEAMP